MGKIKNYTKLDALNQNKIIERILDDNYEKNLYLVSDKHMYLILDLINNPRPNIQLNLPDNLRIIKSYNTLKITRKTKKDIKYHIIISNTTLLPNGKIIEIKENSDSTSNNCIRLNSQELKLPLSFLSFTIVLAVIVPIPLINDKGYINLSSFITYLQSDKFIIGFTISTPKRLHSLIAFLVFNGKPI